MSKPEKGTAEQRFQEALALKDAGELTAATDILASLAQEASDSIGFWLVFGDAREELGDLSGAVTCYGNAVRLAPTHELASRSLFHCLWELSQKGDEEAQSRALAEIRRFLSVSDSQVYEEIIQELHLNRQLLWPNVRGR